MLRRVSMCRGRLPQLLSRLPPLLRPTRLTTKLAIGLLLGSLLLGLLHRLIPFPLPANPFPLPGVHAQAPVTHAKQVQATSAYPVYDRGAANVPAAGANLASVIPAYWGNNQGAWQQLEQTHPAGSIAVANFSAGPPKAGDGTFLQDLTQAHAAGLKVIGYVHTGYGSRALADIEKDIDGWYVYPIDGIFLDEGQANDANLSFYQTIADYIRGKVGNGYLVVLNAGWVPSSSQYLNAADLIMAFEATASQLSVFPVPSWMTDSSRFAAIVENVPSSQLDSIAQQAAQDHFGYVYTIPDSQNYGQLPSYWAQETTVLGGNTGSSPSSTPTPTPTPGSGSPPLPPQPGQFNPVDIFKNLWHLITGQTLDLSPSGIAQGIVSILVTILRLLLGQTLANMLIGFAAQGSFMWVTPAAMTYNNPSLAQLWSGMMMVAGGFFLLILMWNGILLMWRRSSFDYAAAIELLPQAFMAFLLAAFSQHLFQVLIDLNNALCGGLANVDLFQVLNSNSGVILFVLALLIYAAMGVMLIITNVLRLGLLGIELALAPICCMCFGTKATEPIGRLWLAATLATVFVQFLQGLAITVGIKFLTPLVTGSLPNDSLLSILASIAVLFLTLQIPKWLQQAALQSIQARSLPGAVGGAVGGAFKGTTTILEGVEKISTFL